MKLEQQLDLLKEDILKAFFNQMGGDYDPLDWKIQFNRRSNGTLVSLTLVTKRTDDELRLRVNITGTGRKNFGAFVLQVKPNHGSSNLNDEVFVAEAEITKVEYPAVFKYVESPEFIKFQNTRPRLRLINPMGYLKLMSGFPLKTQQ